MKPISKHGEKLLLAAVKSAEASARRAQTTATEFRFHADQIRTMVALLLKKGKTS